jgi:hypothetical protein
VLSAGTFDKRSRGEETKRFSVLNLLASSSLILLSAVPWRGGAAVAAWRRFTPVLSATTFTRAQEVKRRRGFLL